MNDFIENEFLKVEISKFGAEMQSIFSKKGNRECLWNGDSQYWGRRSPVLFPFVGALKNKKYMYEGNEFSVGQHGFARDMIFEKISNTDTEIWYELNYNDDTLLKYPFKFCLKIGYKLEKESIKVKWIVENKDSKLMYFSIGAHPAFVFPNIKREECYIKFDSNSVLKNTGIEGGLANEQNIINGEIVTENGYLKIDNDLFKYDALILENNQVKEVSLCLPDKREFVKVKFDAPLVGIWSPYKDNCPFVCIEPWYGRCDSKDFEGNLEDRKWQQKLDMNECKKFEYEIILTDVQK